MRAADIFSLTKAAGRKWGQDKVTRHAAALSYYTVFSLAPLLLIAISVAGLVFGQEAARHQIVGELQGFIGQDGAKTIQTLIENASKPKSGIIAAAAGFAILLFGASGVFGQIQDSLNSIWGVRPKQGRGLLGMLRDRFASFSMVLVIGFLLLVSLMLSAVLSAVAAYFGNVIPDAHKVLLHAADLLINFGVVALLFAMIYKVLPDARIRWNDVWIGATVTALLFSLGRFLIGLYLGRSGVASAFGAAGSLAVILIWVYYSSQILFFGAEFTQAYASRFGSHVTPAENAEKIPTLAEIRIETASAPSGSAEAARPANESGAGKAGASAEAAKFRRRVAVVWRHRKAIASATALAAAPLLWAFTGKASDFSQPRRRRGAKARRQ